MKTVKTTLRSAGFFLAAVCIVAVYSCTSGDKRTDHTEDRNDKKIEQPKRDSVLRPDSSVVTVAFVLPSADGQSIDVLFNEREQVFTIPKKDKSFEAFNRSLEEARKSNSPLKIITDAKRASISAIQAPGAAELQNFNLIRKEILKGDSALKIDVRRIDTSVFNNIENLKWPSLRLCTTVVPNYAKAKEIFDYCAQQSCNLPGPYAIDHCIPFQYVWDGCYARAHKMRWIIEKHFKYCSQKVFSFAYVNGDKLSVKADKWGGCCINWWYHVAPLIKVQVKIRNFTFTRTYVIDPSMFNQPVLLSTWLAAQENPACSDHAHVSMYSIQPSSAYTPSSPVGVNFTTDPNYTATNQTLINYANLTTCY